MKLPRDASAAGVYGHRIEICVADQAKRITRDLGPSAAPARGTRILIQCPLSPTGIRAKLTRSRLGPSKPQDDLIRNAVRHRRIRRIGEIACKLLDSTRREIC